MTTEFLFGEFAIGDRVRYNHPGCPAGVGTLVGWDRCDSNIAITIETDDGARRTHNWANMSTMSVIEASMVRPGALHD